MNLAVTATAVVLALASFAAFLFFTAKQLNAAKEAGTAVKDTVASVGATKSLADLDIGKFLENAGKLVDSLAKAGPGLSALGASVLFLAIAAYNVNQSDVASNPKTGATDQAKSTPPGK
jgi:hypothetical protein